MKKKTLKKSNIRGSALINVMIAAAMIGGLSMVFSDIYLNMTNSQQLILQRQDITNIHMNIIDVLKDTTICTNNFSGEAAPVAPTILTKDRIRSSLTDDFMVVDPDRSTPPDIVYGSNNTLFLEKVELRNYRAFNATSLQGTADLIIVFKGRGQGILGKSVFRNILVAITLNGVGNIVNCTAIGTELNRNWSRNLGAAAPYHIYFADDTDSDGVGDSVATGNISFGCSSAATTPPSGWDYSTTPPTSTPNTPPTPCNALSSEPGIAGEKLHILRDTQATANYDTHYNTSGPATEPSANVYASGQDLNGNNFKFKHTANNSSNIENYALMLTPSDRKLKKEIESIKVGDDLLTVHGYHFNYKGENTLRIGLIAQEVEEKFPEAVYTDRKTNLKRVAYNKLVAPLIQSTNALAKRVSDLKLQQAILEKKISRLPTQQ